MNHESFEVQFGLTLPAAVDPDATSLKFCVTRNVIPNLATPAVITDFPMARYPGLNHNLFPVALRDLPAAIFGVIPFPLMIVPIAAPVVAPIPVGPVVVPFADDDHRRTRQTEVEADMNIGGGTRRGGEAGPAAQGGDTRGENEFGFHECFFGSPDETNLTPGLFIFPKLVYNSQSANDYNFRN